MSSVKSVGVHLGLAVVAGITALSLWTKEAEPEAVTAASAQVQVWSGTPDQLEFIAFEGKELKVKVEPKKDELGRWFVVHLNQVKRQSKDPENPHESPENPHAPPSKAAKEPKGEWVKSSFVSVKGGTTLAEALAPLMALRAVGRIDKERAEEFGFDKPEGTLTVKLKGAEHKLTVGGLTPGGGDRYVRLAGSNEAYAVPGDALRGVLQPDTRLLETNLHQFDSADVKRVKVTYADKSRELLRVEGKPNAWASVENPLEQDETAVNWMSKVDRLRVSEYLPKQPPALGPNALVLRIEYFDAKKSIGFTELFKTPAEPGAESKDKYIVRTETTRWYGEVLASRAEQVERDVGSVVGGGK
ncbi:MAG TPA: DUF4340 domain-containing protein [Polyangiaceae bacterium]|nr:DUF4340 domain-containing protein [Polyangiaceae bacterium]